MSKKKFWKAKAIEGFQPVMIDMDVYKLIEASRSSFAEMPNAILRRLLDLDGERQPDRARPRRAKSGGAAGGGWSKIDRRGKAVFLPDGTELRAAYAGQTIVGHIAEGRWQVGDAAYNSPSAALIGNVTSRDGKPVNVNGWRHWDVKVPGTQTWQPLASFELPS